MCSWFFILLVMFVCLCLLSPSARATVWRGNWLLSLLGVLFALLGVGLYGEGLPVWALFVFLLLGAFVFLALARLRRGSAVWRRSPFSPAPAQQHWCPTCGNPLPANAPHGICPRCLLRQGLESPPPQAAPEIGPFGDAGKFFGGLFPPQDAR